MITRKISVLVVDDSEVARMLLAHMIEHDPCLKLAGTVNGGAAAVAFMESATPPDVVLMDIHMDGMDGFDAARRIMESRPVPVVMCSAVTDVHSVATAFRVYEAGAVALVEKPPGPGHPRHEQMTRDVLQTLRLMSEVKVVRRWARPVPPQAVKPPPGRSGVAFVGIGASTGGPPALQVLLAGLPRDFPVPILIVQHISAGFLPGLAEWLGQTTPLQVQIAANRIEARPGHVYLAPDDFHLGVDERHCLKLEKSPRDNGLRPSVDHMFLSLAAHCGVDAVGILLTGMGRDGARGLRVMHERGATTFVQDRATSVIHGMPGEAIALGAASSVLSIDRIADALLGAVKPTPAGRAKP